MKKKLKNPLKGQKRKALREKAERLGQVRRQGGKGQKRKALREKAERLAQVRHQGGKSKVNAASANAYWASPSLATVLLCSPLLPSCRLNCPGPPPSLREWGDNSRVPPPPAGTSRQTGAR